MRRHNLTPLSRVVGAAPSAMSAAPPADNPHPNPPPPQSDVEAAALAQQILAAGKKARTPTGTSEPVATEDERPYVEMFGVSEGGLGPRPTTQGMTSAQKQALGEEIIRQGRRRRGEEQ